jgi:hypothetical protein
VPVVVKGLRDVNAAFAKTDRDLRLGWRAGMRQVAEPVRRDAEQSAMSDIRRMPGSPKWARMRVGVTRQMVYVAPRQRGTRGRGPAGRARPNLGNLLMDRAMQPALERHEHEITARFEQLLDKVADGFNRG